MKLVYSLNPEDYLQYTLFYNSTNEESKKLRRKAWASVILSFFFFGVLLYNYADSWVFYFYALTAALVAVIFPFFHKSRLKKQYLNAIEKNYRNSFGKPKELFFDDDCLTLSSDLESSKLDYSAIESIQEISSHYFLNLKSGTHIIVPKAEIKEDTAVTAKLDGLSKEHAISYSRQLNWKW